MASELSERAVACRADLGKLMIEIFRVISGAVVTRTKEDKNIKSGRRVSYGDQ